MLASEPALADRAEHLGGWARELAADAELQTQAIDVEQLASMATGKWGRGNRYERPPSETPPEIELMTHLERVGSTGALLMLRGFEHVAGGAAAAAAAKAAARLSRGGVSVPQWAEAIGCARPTGAWVVHDDEFGDGTTLFAEFEQAGCPTHTVAIYVDHNMASAAKIIGLTRAMAPDDLASLGAATEVPLELMGGCMRSALGKVHPMNRRNLDHEDAIYYALACARADALPLGVEIDRPEVTPDERFDLMTEFLDSEEGSRYREDIDAQAVVALAIDYCAARDGQPLRWSPIAVELFFVEWLPEQAGEQLDVLARAPEVLPSWISYAGRRRDMPEALLTQTIDAVDEFAEVERVPARARGG